MIVKDREAREWRAKNVSELRSQLKAFTDRAFRRSQSEKSAQAKYVAIASLCGWQKKLPNDIVAEVKADKLTPYRLLDEYLSYLVSIKIAPNSIKDYLSGVKKWLRFNGIEVSNEKVKDDVELPRTYTITQDKTPTLQQLRDILFSTDVRGKALISVLSSSGMRIGEALSLRVKDIDFAGHPILVRLRAEVTKDRQARVCFISDEATAFLKEFLQERIGEKEAFIFQGRFQGVRPDGKKFARGEKKNEPMSYFNADVILTTALKKAGLYAKDDNGRDVLHIHSLRKFFFTRMVGVNGREITEALMGHRAFLDSAYRRFTIEDLGEFYLKGMSAISTENLGQNNREEIGKIIELSKWEGAIQFGYMNGNLRQSPEEMVKEKELQLQRPLTVEEKIRLYRSKLEYLKTKEHDQLFEDENSHEEAKQIARKEVSSIFSNNKNDPNPLQHQSRGKQVAVKSAELDQYLDLGYKMLPGGSLSDGRIVLEPPTRL